MNTTEILKSLADDTRLSIVRKLAREPEEVASSNIINDCALALELSQPTMSHHFARLTRSGVISQRKVATEKLYKLNHELLAQVGIDPHKL